jgi:hypothetical protein
MSPASAQTIVIVAWLPAFVYLKRAGKQRRWLAACTWRQFALIWGRWIRREAFGWQNRRVFGWQNRRVFGWQNRRVFGRQNRRVFGGQNRPVFGWNNRRVFGWQNRRVYIFGWQNRRVFGMILLVTSSFTHRVQLSNQCIFFSHCATPLPPLSLTPLAVFEYLKP